MYQIKIYTQNKADEFAQSFFGNLRFLKQTMFITYLAFRNFFLLFSSPVENRGKFIMIGKTVVIQIYFTAVQSIQLVSFIALITGSLAVLPISTGLSLFGQADLVGKILISIISREIAPLFTAFIIVARSGTAIASELGNMQVNKEIDSMKAIGVDYTSVIIFPRIVGGIISLLCLNFIFNLMSLGGGYVVSNLLHPFAFSSYVNSLANYLTPLDILVTFLKCIGSAIIIFSLSIAWGLSVKKSSHEVPQVTSRAVVWCLATVMFWNMMMSLISYLGTNG
jgi:phospholipid/cholesterol/gamma-HCH transport system permease protein